MDYPDLFSLSLYSRSAKFFDPKLIDDSPRAKAIALITLVFPK